MCVVRRNHSSSMERLPGPSSDFTHAAFGDESSHLNGRYRSVAVACATRPDIASHVQQISALLAESGVGEMKWTTLRSGRERLAALKLVRWTVREVLNGSLRIDALVWDTHDSRPCDS